MLLFKQKTAYEMRLSLVGSERGIRDRAERRGEAHVGGAAARIVAERKARKKAEREQQARKSAMGERCAKS